MVAILQPQEAVQPEPQQPLLDPIIVRKLVLVSTIAAGVQFGWAVQLTHLTPQTQRLGLSHTDVSLIWLCGPVTGLFVQPIVGHHSDHCFSRFGRRRPFILAGTLLLILAVSVIGFCGELGQLLGDPATGIRVKTIGLFVLGFWFLDIANNMIQGPCRAMLADLSGDSDTLVTIGNAFFAFFMAVGNIAGYGAGALEHLYTAMPFTKTSVCDENCAGLKVCLILSGILAGFTTTLVMFCVEEVPLDRMQLECWEEGYPEQEQPLSFFMQIWLAAKTTTMPIRTLYMVTALSWMGIFPFLLYDTDWMGREIYGGKGIGTVEEMALYTKGVHACALALIFYVLSMGAVSLLLEPLLQICGSVQRLWSSGNFILALCMGFTVIISKVASGARAAAQRTPLDTPPVSVKVMCVLLFAGLGIPQAVIFSIPFALASIYSKDTRTGQGLALGLLNLAIVVPQIIVTLTTGPLDALFGCSNLPGFVWGGIAAVIGGFAALTLPDLEAPQTEPTTETPGFL